MNRDEMLNFLKNEARGISVMFGPNCETIVHDMTRPGHPILAIFNGTVTGRGRLDGGYLRRHRRLRREHLPE